MATRAALSQPAGSSLDRIRFSGPLALTSKGASGSIASAMDGCSNPLRQGPTHILVNPAAGGNKSGRLLQQVKEFAEAVALPAFFHVPETAGEMETLAAKLVASGAKALLAMGGDGTVQTLVNVAEARRVAIGVLPAGGGNDFARAFGLPSHPVEALRAMLGGSLRRVDLARARTADGRERWYCGGGGLGLDAEAVRHASERYARRRGKSRYVLSALRALRTFPAVRVTAEIAGSQAQVEKKVLVAAVLNTPSYGAGLRLAEKARPDDGRLDLVFLEELGPGEVARIIFDWMWRGTLSSRRISTLAVTRVKLTAERPCLFHGDGELFGPAPVEVAVMPGAIAVLAPGGTDLAP